MKEKFDWYFHPSKEEINHIWKEGILTVDTNVLLDLYRYHESTRGSLIQSLQEFEGRKWLSYQAAKEFFRNRNKVIVSSEKTFKQAQEETEKLSASLKSAVSQLQGNRIIPAEVANELSESVESAILLAQQKINGAKVSYPKFLQEDPILEQLASLFKDAVGEDFKTEDTDRISTLAEDRKKNKIPPGYMDDDKDGDQPYGDYFLWLQIIEHAKSESRPILLVTSERKEDWWEKISGKTTGPRPELLREAMQHSGQRILIYQTERFLEHALQRFHQPVNTAAIEEIRAVSTLRAEFEAAVKLKEQSINENTIYRNTGTLNVELRRPVRNFTVSGHLDPNMHHVPALNVCLLSTPESTPQYRLSAGTGTTHDFNIHIVCEDRGDLLPVGAYVFEYEANCANPFDGAGILESTKI
jgi:hypothetical protein